VGVASPDVAVLPRPLPGRRSITFRERVGSLGLGGSGGVGALAGGGALACVVYAATMLAEMRFSNSFTRSFILVLLRFSVASWYASIRASRRDAIVARPDSSSARPSGGEVFPAIARACSAQAVWSTLFCSSSYATFNSRTSTLDCASFTLMRASALYSAPLVPSRI
jgi:hypothetical protein